MEVRVRVGCGQFPYVVGNVKVQGVTTLVTDFDIVSIGTERLNRSRVPTLRAK
jgi:hypothetical protein